MPSSTEEKRFKLLFHLQKEQPWIAKHVDALTTLLFNDCKNDEQHELILNLLGNFEYLSNDKFHALLENLAENIVTDPILNELDTQVVAMAANSAADSSQYVLYGLKPIFEKLGWVNYKHVNSFGSSYKTYKRSVEHKNIVLIDEFVGSGSTLVKRVEAIKKTFSSNGVDDFSVRARVLVATSMGIDYARSEGIDLQAKITFIRS